VGTRAVLDAVVKRKIRNSRRESNPGTLIIQSVAERYTVGNVMLKPALTFSHHLSLFLCLTL